ISLQSGHSERVTPATRTSRRRGELSPWPGVAVVVAAAFVIVATVVGASFVHVRLWLPLFGDGPTTHPPDKDVQITACRHVGALALVTLAVTNHSSKPSNYAIDVAVTRSDGQLVGTAYVGQSNFALFDPPGARLRPKLIVNPHQSATVQASAPVFARGGQL